MPTTITTASVVQKVNQVLNEDQGTPGWELNAVNGDNVLTSAGGIAQLLNDEKDFLFRRVIPASATFTASYASGQYCQRYDAFTVNGDGTSGSTTLTGAKLWWPRAASRVGAVLVFTTEDVLKVENSAYQTAQGVVNYWYRRDARYVGVYNVPANSGGTTITVDGLFIPADVPADGTGGTDAFDAAQIDLLVDGICVRAMIKVGDDNQSLLSRLPAIQARYNAGCMQYWSEIPAYLRDAADGPCKVPPVAGGK